MNCIFPLRIRNKYTGEWMYVACNHCDGCLSEKIVANVIRLREYFKKFKNVYFGTLTYDNKHIPFVFSGRSEIFRYDTDDFPTIVVNFDDVFRFDLENVNKIVNHPLDFVQAVLYYPDVQKFFKRFRKFINKNYGKDKKFSYFVIGEYGPVTKRSHYHVAIMSDSITYSQFKEGFIKNWKLCDWSRLDENESFKVGFGGLQSYLAAYVNSCFSDDRFYEDKRIKQKTWRSKDINFCVESEVEKEIKRFYDRRSNFGKGFELSDFFKRIDVRCKNALSSVSDNVFSTEFLFAYFSKPKGYDSLSSFAKYRRIVEIVRFYQTRSKIASVPLNGIYIDSCSSDYRTWLSYKRFCNLLGLDIYSYGSVYYYADSFDSIRNYVASLNLKKQMLKRLYLSVVDYEYELFNTDCYDLDIRKFRRFHRLHIDESSLSELENRVLSSKIIQRRNEFINLNKKFFLPKHLNEYGKKHFSEAFA